MDAKQTLREGIHEIIFEADTRAGKWFDVLLMCLIVGSVAVVMLDSVQAIHAAYGTVLACLEWVFTLLFTLEYFLRVWCTKRVRTYIFSFYGIVDLLSTLPAYLGLLFAAGHFLLVVRVLRLLRVFRVLKLLQFVSASNVLLHSLKRSRHKIAVFFLFVLLLVTILGSLMYFIESPESGFTSIPKSIYWAIVTLTTVGYGDIAPATLLGQALASFIMLLGYAIIAVPTGIITADLWENKQGVPQNTNVCSTCNASTHDDDAKYCKYCGARL